MNNDDMILKMLTEIRQSMSNMEENVSKIEGNVSNLENDIKSIKRDVKKLDKNDNLILDEIERVHEIFDKRYNEIKAKIV